jgi:hypothetical protein
MKDYYSYIDKESSKEEINNYALNNSYLFLKEHSENDWAKPYLDIAINNCLKYHTKIFIFEFGSCKWSKKYIDENIEFIKNNCPFVMFDLIVKKQCFLEHKHSIAVKCMELNLFDFYYYILDDQSLKEYASMSAEKISIDHPKYYFDYEIYKEFPEYLNFAIFNLNKA